MTLTGGRHAPGVLELWVLHVPEWAALSPDGILDADETRRADRFVREDDRARFRAAHLGLRVLLGGHLGVTPGSVRLARAACPRCGAAHGRPVVTGEPDLHFSLSHTGEVVLLGVAATAVGVDAETPARHGLAAELAGELHPAERDALAGLPADRRDAAFLACWVRKEAYLKGLGTGLAGGLDRHLVGPGPRFGVPDPAPADLGGWTLVDVDLGETAPGHPAAAAVNGVRDALQRPARPRRLHPATVGRSAAPGRF